MRRLSYVAVLLLIVLVVVVSAQPLFGRSVQAAATDNVFAFSIGVFQPDNSVLYSVFVLTDKQAAKALTVTANIPADALSSEIVIAPQSATLTSMDADKTALTWQVDSLDASTILGPFTYRVSLPDTLKEIPSGITGKVTWDAGSIDITPMNGNLNMFEESASITFDAAGTTNDKGESVGTPVGQSGIWLYVPKDAVAGIVTLRFTRLLIDADNVPQDSDTWWCALFKIETDTPLTLNAPIVIAVPTRQPLTPGINVQLLAQTGNGTWQELPTAQGLGITNDGAMAEAMITGDLPTLIALGVNNGDRNQASGSTSSPAGGGFGGAGFNNISQFGSSGFNGGFGGSGFNGGFNSGRVCSFNFCP